MRVAILELLSDSDGLNAMKSFCLAASPSCETRTGTSVWNGSNCDGNSTTGISKIETVITVFASSSLCPGDVSSAAETTIYGMSRETR